MAAEDIDLALLRSFVMAARMGSLNRAAQALALTQPAVSQQLRRLERAVGAELLRRTTRGVAVTPAGERVLRFAQRVLLLMDELSSVAAPAEETPSHFRIGLLEDVAVAGLSAVLSDFAAVHPTAVLDVVVAGGAALGPGLVDGTLDVVVGDPESIGSAAGPPRRRGPFPLAWAAHPRIDLAADPLPVVIFRAPCAWRDGVLDTLAGAGRRWRVAFEASSLSALQAAIEAGLGLGALLPQTVSTEMMVPDDVALPRAPSVELALYRRREFGQPAALAQLESLLWRTLGSGAQDA
jgi:DNA-binding transcriptional LysR family regulator